MPSRTRIALLACLVIGACECEDAGNPSKSPQPGSSTSAESTRPALPPPEGTPLEPEALARFAPDTLAGFVPEGDAQPRTTPLPNGGKLSTVRRVYKHAQQVLQLEVTDSIHAPAVRQIVTGHQGKEHKTSTSEIKGVAIAGEPALVQWHEATQTAIVNIVVAERFLVNVKVSPAASNEVAIAAANAIALAELAALVPKPRDDIEPAAPAAPAQKAPAP